LETIKTLNINVLAVVVEDGGEEGGEESSESESSGSSGE